MCVCVCVCVYIYIYIYAYIYICIYICIYVYRWDSQVPTRESLSSLRSHISSLDEEERARVVMDFKVLVLGFWV